MAANEANSLEYLLSQGANPRALDEDENTPLIYAAHHNNMECFDILYLLSKPTHAKLHGETALDKPEFQSRHAQLQAQLSKKDLLEHVSLNLHPPVQRLSFKPHHILPNKKSPAWGFFILG